MLMKAIPTDRTRASEHAQARRLKFARFAGKHILPRIVLLILGFEKPQMAAAGCTTGSCVTVPAGPGTALTTHTTC